jgi:hypothetical protein
MLWEELTESESKVNERKKKQFGVVTSIQNLTAQITHVEIFHCGVMLCCVPEHQFNTTTLPPQQNSHQYKTIIRNNSIHNDRHDDSLHNNAINFWKSRIVPV